MKSTDQPEVQRIEIHYNDGTSEHFAPANALRMAPMYVVRRMGKKVPKPSAPMSPEELAVTLFGTVVEARRVGDFSKDPKLRALWKHWQALITQAASSGSACEGGEGSGRASVLMC